MLSEHSWEPTPGARFGITIGPGNCAAHVKKQAWWIIVQAGVLKDTSKQQRRKIKVCGLLGKGFTQQDLFCCFYSLPKPKKLQNNIYGISRSSPRVTCLDLLSSVNANQSFSPCRPTTSIPWTRLICLCSSQLTYTVALSTVLPILIFFNHIISAV